MASASPELIILDLISRRVMFALELIDPVTGRLVSAGLRVTAKGWPDPRVTLSGRFVWRDVDPPAARLISLVVQSVGGIFRNEAFDVAVPAHISTVSSEDLIQRRTLQPTGLYDPPPGMLAAAGMLLDDPVSRTPLAGVTVRANLHADPSPVTAGYQAVSDSRGGFVAAMPNLGAATLLGPPKPAPEGGLVGWLAFTNANAEVRHSPLLAGLRRGRMLRVPTPFFWADLLAVPPPPP